MKKTGRYNETIPETNIKDLKREENMLFLDLGPLTFEIRLHWSLSGVKRIK